MIHNDSILFDDFNTGHHGVYVKWKPYRLVGGKHQSWNDTRDKTNDLETHLSLGLRLVWEDLVTYWKKKNNNTTVIGSTKTKKENLTDNHSRSETVGPKNALSNYLRLSRSLLPGVLGVRASKDQKVWIKIIPRVLSFNSRLSTTQALPMILFSEITLASPTLVCLTQ